MQYVEVGNEDWFDRTGPDRNSTYDGRFAQFYDAIKKKYPQLKAISSCGYEQPQSLWVKSRTPDLVDEHYYRNMEEMMAQSLKYDTYSRTNESKIFCGEWATRVGSPTPNMSGALGDAAWMTCMERNSDIVLLSCYAPLFVNVSQLNGQGRSMQWASDLIGYDALTSYGSPSYYAQKMFSTLHGDQILATDSQNIPTREGQPRAQSGGNVAPRQLRQIFFDATRDNQSGIIYLKVVNAAGTAKQINIQINGAQKIEAEGEAVVIPGSRGSLSYLVKPLGDGESRAWSLAHGAGRKWARSEARQRMRERFGMHQLTQTPLGGRVICGERDLLYEEAPAAYKNIEDVVQELVDAGLASVVATFRPLLTYKTRAFRR